MQNYKVKPRYKLYKKEETAQLLWRIKKLQDILAVSKKKK